MIIPIVCPKCQEKNKVNGEVVNGKITLQCPKCLAKFSKVLPKIEKEEIKPEIKEEKVEESKFPKLETANLDDIEIEEKPKPQPQPVIQVGGRPNVPTGGGYRVSGPIPASMAAAYGINI
jgi:hypothetical protein